MNSRTRHRHTVLFLFVNLFSLALASAAMAQQKERTLDEIKTEAIKRAENGMYPLIGLDPADVREAFAAIKTSDYDEWAAGITREAARVRESAGSVSRARKINGPSSRSRENSV